MSSISSAELTRITYPNRVLAQLIVALGGALALIACSDQTSSYSTLAEARNARVIEKGWMPAILPNSTRSVTLTTRVDAARGWGGFNFECADFAEFESNLSTHSLSSRLPRGVTIGSIQDRIAKGWRGGLFSSGRTQWVFACDVRDEGECRCEFEVLQERS